MLKDYDAAFLPHCWFLFTLWWGCWYANIRSQCKVSDTIKAFGPLVDLTLAYHVWHMKRCVADIHDPDHERLCRVHSGSWYDEVLIFLSFVKVILCLARECVKVIQCLAGECVIVIIYLARECVIMIQCVAYIHDLCMTLSVYLNIKILLSPWIWLWQDRHTKFWHMGVSWPLYDIGLWPYWVRGYP